MNAVASRSKQPDPREVLAAIESEKARRSGSKSFIAFVCQAWPIIDQRPLVKTWYLEALALHLESVARGEITRFIGNGPPRNGKSNLFAILWPAWVWTWDPTTKFIYLSYSDDLVVEHSVKCRTLIESDWYRQTYRPEWRLGHPAHGGHRFTLDSRLTHGNRQDDFVNTAGGRRISGTIRSGVTGRGADIVAIDDPLSTEEASSTAARDHARQTIIQTVSTRFNDVQTGRAAILMQRVHRDDPSDWAIRAGYEHFCVPMEFVPDRRSVTYRVIDRERQELWRDPRIEAGELLVPERFPREALTQIRLEFGSAGYAAQFQQQPSAHPQAGSYFKRGWFEFVDTYPAEVDKRVRRWDLASTAGGGDWTVGVRLSRTANGVFYVEDVKRVQAGPRDVRELVRATAELDEQECHIVIPQDPGQAGKDQAQEYVSLLAGYHVSTPRETGDKITRAGPASAQCEAGNVKIVRGRWNEAFLEILEAFPDESAHDDDVDAFAGAVTAIALPPKSTFALWGEADLS